MSAAATRQRTAAGATHLCFALRCVGRWGPFYGCEELYSDRGWLSGTPGSGYRVPWRQDSCSRTCQSPHAPRRQSTRPTQGSLPLLTAKEGPVTKRCRWPAGILLLSSMVSSLFPSHPSNPCTRIRVYAIESVLDGCLIFYATPQRMPHGRRALRLPPPLSRQRPRPPLPAGRRRPVAVPPQEAAATTSVAASPHPATRRMRRSLEMIPSPRSAVCPFKTLLNTLHLLTFSPFFSFTSSPFVPLGCTQCHNFLPADGEGRGRGRGRGRGDRGRGGRGRQFDRHSMTGKTYVLF